MREVVANLSNEQLVRAMPELVGKERRELVVLLAHLGEIDARELHVGAGYSSLWAYCTQALRYSESQAHRRVVAARALRRKPALAALLEDGRLNLCTLALVGQEDDELVAKACGKSRREVEELVAARRAKPATKRDVVRRVVADEPVAAPIAVFAAEAPAVALAPVKTHRISFSAGPDVVEKLERLKEVLGAATLEDVILKAADALLDKVAPERREQRRQKRGVAKRVPKQSPKTPRVSRALRDAILVRDGQQCTWRSPGGHRCGETRRLEVDHIRPNALGGSSSDLANLRTLCKTHNLYRARQTFGVLVPRRR